VYVIASMCWVVGRIEAAVGYSDAGRMVICNDCGEVPYGIEGWLGTAYNMIGRPERSVEWCRTQIARGRDTHAVTRACLVLALTSTQPAEDAMTAATGLIDAAEATGNPYACSFALMAYGLAFRHADPDRALDALRRGLVIAHDSGIRTIETHLTDSMALLVADFGDPLVALEYFAVVIRNHRDSGNTANMRFSLTALAASLDRLGRSEPAATIAGFAFDPLTTGMWVPEINTAISHLRDVLGNQTYESLTHMGETMTTAAIVAYAYDQIKQAQTELDNASK
jgi:hypothetical protein